MVFPDTFLRYQKPWIHQPQPNRSRIPVRNGARHQPLRRRSGDRYIQQHHLAAPPHPSLPPAKAPHNLGNTRCAALEEPRLCPDQ